MSFDAFVPFAYEKSIYAVIAILGVLKAGAALMLLNPNDLVARLSKILGSVRVDVVVTSNELAPIFRPLMTHVAIISHEKLAVPASEHAASLGKGKPTDVMLVLFTSGSTGRPKGIVHTHASMATHALVHEAAMSYQGARVLQFAAYTFDVAIFDILCLHTIGKRSQVQYNRRHKCHASRLRDPHALIRGPDRSSRGPK